MEDTRKTILEIADRLYDLDAEVYRLLVAAFIIPCAGGPNKKPSPDKKEKKCDER